jgi:hypothetical protein
MPILNCHQHHFPNLKWGRYNMYLSCCDKDSPTYFYDCLMSTLHGNGVGANDCKFSLDGLSIRNTEEVEITNFGYPSNDRPFER